ncbi:MAG: hypothetical protein Q9182_003885 [Xanthomendoza sp. 2 TL-2023]
MPEPLDGVKADGPPEEPVKDVAEMLPDDGTPDSEAVVAVLLELPGALIPPELLDAVKPNGPPVEPDEDIAEVLSDDKKLDPRTILLLLELPEALVPPLVVELVLLSELVYEDCPRGSSRWLELESVEVVNVDEVLAKLVTPAELVLPIEAGFGVVLLVELEPVRLEIVRDDDEDAPGASVNVVEPD